MGLGVADQDRRVRRRDVDVVAHDRPHDAYQLHLAGVDWTKVAEETGYASGRVASLAVDAYLQKIAIEQGPEHRRQALQLELDRLNALQAAFWAAAMDQDRNAAEVVLKVIARRCKVLGFDRPDQTTSAPRTVVIGGNTEEYFAGLQSLIDDQ